MEVRLPVTAVCGGDLAIVASVLTGREMPGLKPWKPLLGRESRQILQTFGEAGVEPRCSLGGGRVGQYGDQGLG